jgi:hypothetical protein
MSPLEREIQKEAQRVALQMIESDPSKREEVLDRLSRYPLTIGGLHLCPKCWLDNETERPLRRTQSDGKYMMTCFGCDTQLLPL